MFIDEKFIRHINVVDEAEFRGEPTPQMIRQCEQLNSLTCVKLSLLTQASCLTEKIYVEESWDHHKKQLSDACRSSSRGSGYITRPDITRRRHTCSHSERSRIHARGHPKRR